MYNSIKPCHVLFFVLACMTPGIADTVWTSPITSQVTWTKADSPHTWTGNMTISSGGVVNIEAGAIVKVPSGAHLYISGGARILATGASDDPIRFGGVSELTPGATVWIDSSLTSEFRFCHFAHLERIRVSTQSPQGNHLFEHCVFRKFTSNVIELDNAPARILHCLFRDNPSDRYGVSGYYASFSDEKCPTIWYCVFDRNGLAMWADNYATLALNHRDFFRYNRVQSGTGIRLYGDRYPGFENLRVLDCDLGDTTSSLSLSASGGWDGGLSGSMERCRLSSLTRSYMSVGGVTNLANNYWGTTNMATITAVVFGGALSTNVVLPISTTNMFPQADLDGSDEGNLTRQADADLVKKAVVGLISLTPEQQAAADVDRNGVVDTRDALLIESYINGLMWKLPVP